MMRPVLSILRCGSCGFSVVGLGISLAMASRVWIWLMVDMVLFFLIVSVTSRLCGVFLLLVLVGRWWLGLLVVLGWRGGFG